MGNKQKKRDNTGKKSKEIKLKPVKIKFDKKEFKDKADESDLEESLENENVFQFDNVAEFLRSSRSPGLNVPVLPMENAGSPGIRFRSVSREGDDEKSNFSYDVNGNRNYISGDNLNNPNNANNADTTNNVYRAAESNVNQDNNVSRMDLGELNSSDIFRANRSRERTNPNQETSLRDNYSSADKNYQSPSSIDIQEDNKRRIPGDRRRGNF